MLQYNTEVAVVSVAVLLVCHTLRTKQSKCHCIAGASTLIVLAIA
jgi:hypothetical protein